MVLGPTEAFTPEQLHELYDVNVVGTQRVNRAALPRMRGALLDELPDRLGALVPPGADAGAVATAIADVVDLPPGRRPLRTHVDPSRDGSEVVSVVADRIRAEFFRRAGLEDLSRPAPAADRSRSTTETSSTAVRQSERPRRLDLRRRETAPPR